MLTVIRSIAVPRSLLATPDRFGGQVESDLQRGDLLIAQDQVIGVVSREWWKFS
jgi:hypothetical protein